MPEQSKEGDEKDILNKIIIITTLITLINKLTHFLTHSNTHARISDVCKSGVDVANQMIVIFMSRMSLCYANFEIFAINQLMHACQLQAHMWQQMYKLKLRVIVACIRLHRL